MALEDAFDCVLTDGIMGVGKSGLAQTIALMMRDGEYPYRWFFEMDPANPLGRDDDPTLPKEPLERSKVQWEGFLRQWSAPPTAVIDGRLFNVNVARSLFGGLARSVIVPKLRSLVRLVGSRRTLIVHLVSSDIEALLERTLRTRQDSAWYLETVRSSRYAAEDGETPFRTAVRHLQEAQSITEELVSEFGGESVTVDVEVTSWEAAVGTVAKRLGIDAFRLRPRFSKTPEIEGKYDLQIAEDHFTVEIRKDERGYVITDHPLSRYGGVDDPIVLIADGSGRLLFRSAPVQLHIVETEGATHRIEQVHWHDGDDTSLFAGSYTRIGS